MVTKLMIAAHRVAEHIHWIECQERARALNSKYMTADRFYDPLVTTCMGDLIHSRMKAALVSERSEQGKGGEK